MSFLRVDESVRARERSEEISPLTHRTIADYHAFYRLHRLASR